MSNLHVHVFWNLPTLYWHVILFTNLIDLILLLSQADACRNQCKTLRQKYEDSDLAALVEACLLVKSRQAGKAVQLLQVANSYLEIPYTLKYFSQQKFHVILVNYPLLFEPLGFPSIEAYIKMERNDLLLKLANSSSVTGENKCCWIHFVCIVCKVLQFIQLAQ